MDDFLSTWVGQVGVGGIFVILVLRTVLDFLARYEQRKVLKDSGGDARSSMLTTGENAILERKLYIVLKKVEDIEQRTNDLHAWHNKEDDDGVKVWYVRRSMEEVLIKLTSTLERQTQILAEVAREQRTVVESQKAVLDKISRMARTGDIPRRP